MEITIKNFIIPIQDDLGNELKIWISHPHDSEMTQISRVLAYFNKECRNMPLDSVIMDYERLTEEALLDFNAEYRNNINKRLETFFSRAELSAVCDDGRDFASLSESEKSTFRGALLFISALWRYTYKEKLPGGTQKEVKELMESLSVFFTSQNATEWKDSLANASDAHEPVATEPTQASIKVSPML